ncbi:sensor histidine kinase [Desulfovibrio sulfodismutans]|uniref:histidine kinase n=1 Tax=Desulfolutivibrio sulfodismutans TaxID=63561 RepID=A0A7K3NPX3_9BACT|nr:ATP-binding protein [Desulfolutivibrio sulfodismutans]NDY57873.1 sensor histidine kinase [Desulfolutivibrio sulfodismutans]QLA11794.1 sensor histidine kinase [Desulfolutivibrio sulfodismutans DSM 3696]
MNLPLPVLPVYLVDFFGSALMIVLSFAASRYAFKLMRREPRELLWSYIYMLTLALTAFSVGRSVGHIVRDILVNTGYKEIWESISPISGAINTITFIFISAVTLYYSFVEKGFLLLRQANAKLGEAFEEIRRGRDQAILLERHAISDRMAATLAHETRNPLFTIANFAKSLLRKCDKDEPISSRLQIIVEESHKLEGLIDGILKVKHDLPYLMRRVSVAEVLDGLEKSGRDKAEVARVRLHVSPSPGDIWLQADMESVLVGLGEILANAVEASPKGGVVDIAAEREGDMAVLRIADSGKGIPAAVLPKIFEPCFSTKDYSTGLGLSFAKEILEANHGFVKVESVPERGTTVVVAFPVAASEGDETPAAAGGAEAGR